LRNSKKPDHLNECVQSVDYSDETVHDEKRTVEGKVFIFFYTFLLGSQCQFAIYFFAYIQYIYIALT